MPTTPEPSFARSIDELMDALEQVLRDVAEYARDGFAVDEFLETSGPFLATLKDIAGRLEEADRRGRRSSQSTPSWADVVRARPSLG